jgi:hypothetical protein
LSSSNHETLVGLKTFYGSRDADENERDQNFERFYREMNRFSERWPKRSFKIISSYLDVDDDDEDSDLVNTVRLTVAWRLQDPERGQVAEGLSKVDATIYFYRENEMKIAYSTSQAWPRITTLNWHPLWGDRSIRIPEPNPRPQSGAHQSGLKVINSYWKQNGSVLALSGNPRDRDDPSLQMIYMSPSGQLSAQRIQKGTLLFGGRKSGNSYAGMAYAFSELCEPGAYKVKGAISKDKRTLTLSGKAPIYGPDCDFVGYRDSTLVFNLVRK